jgi:hypothetical protein
VVFDWKAGDEVEFVREKDGVKIRRSRKGAKDSTSLSGCVAPHWNPKLTTARLMTMTRSQTPRGQARTGDEIDAGKVGPYARRIAREGVRRPRAAARIGGPAGDVALPLVDDIGRSRSSRRGARSRAGR